MSRCASSCRISLYLPTSPYTSLHLPPPPRQSVRLELLCAATKLFFKRPAEMQHMLGRLLEAAIADASFTDVHDRAMMYYRMLQSDVNAACQVPTPTPTPTPDPNANPNTTPTRCSRGPRT